MFRLFIVAAYWHRLSKFHCNWILQYIFSRGLHKSKPRMLTSCISEFSNVASSATLYLLLLKHREWYCWECFGCVRSLFWDGNARGLGSHSNTHRHNLQLESENTCYTFLFALCPLIKTIAPPLFSYFHLPDNMDSMPQLNVCGCEGIPWKEIFHGKHSQSNNTRNPLCVWSSLVSCAKVYIKKVELWKTFFISFERPNGVHHNAQLYCFARWSWEINLFSLLACLNQVKVKSMLMNSLAFDLTKG